MCGSPSSHYDSRSSKQRPSNERETGGCNGPLDDAAPAPSPSRRTHVRCFVEESTCVVRERPTETPISDAKDISCVKSSFLRGAATPRGDADPECS